jgi:hypothetical protein
MAVIERAYDNLIDVTGALGLLDPIAPTKVPVEASR